jgi:hypothetical protein
MPTTQENELIGNAAFVRLEKPRETLLIRQALLTGTSDPRARQLRDA